MATHQDYLAFPSGSSATMGDEHEAPSDCDFLAPQAAYQEPVDEFADGGSSVSVRATHLFQE
jgi:hypothetical protein